MKQKYARTVKEALIAVKWIFDNKLEWNRYWRFLSKYDRIIPYINVIECPEENIPLIGSCCLVGCLNLVQTKNKTLHTSVIDKLLAQASIEYIYMNSQSTLEGWNDNSKRTKQEVMDLIQKAIDAE